jgi:hypothetical protein
VSEKNQNKKRRKDSVVPGTLVGQKIKSTLKKWVFFLLNPRLLVCFLVAWFITNGWSYLFLWLGIYFDIDWMSYVGGAYLGLLWVPFTPEKILTVIIAFGILRLVFPNDEKTLAILKEEFSRLKANLSFRKDKRRKRKSGEAEIIDEKENSSS